MVCGPSGAGKTTFAQHLARHYALPLVEIDALRWSGGWTLVPLDVLRGRVSSALAGDRWVAEGPCRDLCDLIGARADLIIWLDFALPVVLHRLARRALARLAGRRTICGGNQPHIGPTALLLLSQMVRRRWGRLGRGESLGEAFLSRPPAWLLARDPRVVRLNAPSSAAAFLAALSPARGPLGLGANTSA